MHTLCQSTVILVHLHVQAACTWYHLSFQRPMCVAFATCREQLLPILSFIPVLGPAIYLLLRPKTDLSK
jgi:hypothetical protein